RNIARAAVRCGPSVNALLLGLGNDSLTLFPPKKLNQKLKRPSSCLDDGPNPFGNSSIPPSPGEFAPNTYRRNSYDRTYNLSRGRNIDRRSFDRDGAARHSFLDRVPVRFLGNAIEDSSITVFHQSVQLIVLFS